MSEGVLSIHIHLEKEDSLWVPTYSPKYNLLGILFYKTLISGSHYQEAYYQMIFLCVSVSASVSQHLEIHHCFDKVLQWTYSIEGQILDKTLKADMGLAVLDMVNDSFPFHDYKISI